MPLFPGTGALSESGAGNLFNARCRRRWDGALQAGLRGRILPAVEDFRPDLVLISAGFDAHRRDPLAEINLDAEDFDWATGKLMDIADRWANGRVVALLEGGYDLKGLADSASAHIRRLMQA